MMFRYITLMACVALLLPAASRAQEFGVGTYRVVTLSASTPLRTAPNPDARILRVGEKGERFRVDSLEIVRGFIALWWRQRRVYASVTDVAIGPQVDHESPAAPLPAPGPPPAPQPAPPPAPPIDAPPNVGFRTFQSGGFDVILTEDLNWKIGRTNERIVVPKGFVTDFASIPQLFWTALPTTGPYRLAAVVHDYLYWEQPCTREQADNLLYIAMVENRVSYPTRTAVHLAVRQFGVTAWTDNARDKRQGIPRYLSAQYDHPGDNVSWPTYRAQLFRYGIRGDTSHVRPPPAYCALGNSTDVPGPTQRVPRRYEPEAR